MSDVQHLALLHYCFVLLLLSVYNTLNGVDFEATPT